MIYKVVATDKSFTPLQEDAHNKRRRTTGILSMSSEQLKEYIKKEGILSDPDKLYLFLCEFSIDSINPRDFSKLRIALAAIGVSEDSIKRCESKIDQAEKSAHGYIQVVIKSMTESIFSGVELDMGAAERQLDLINKLGAVTHNNDARVLAAAQSFRQLPAAHLTSLTLSFELNDQIFKNLRAQLGVFKSTHPDLTPLINSLEDVLFAKAVQMDPKYINALFANEDFSKTPLEKSVFQNLREALETKLEEISSSSLIRRNFFNYFSDFATQATLCVQMQGSLTQSTEELRTMLGRLEGNRVAFDVLNQFTANISAAYNGVLPALLRVQPSINVAAFNELIKNAEAIKGELQASPEKSKSLVRLLLGIVPSVDLRAKAIFQHSLSEINKLRDEIQFHLLPALSPGYLLRETLSRMPENRATLVPIIEIISELTSNPTVAKSMFGVS